MKAKAIAERVASAVEDLILQHWEDIDKLQEDESENPKRKIGFVVELKRNRKCLDYRLTTKINYGARRKDEVEDTIDDPAQATLGVN